MRLKTRSLSAAQAAVGTALFVLCSGCGNAGDGDESWTLPYAELSPRRDALEHYEDAIERSLAAFERERAEVQTDVVNQPSRAIQALVENSDGASEWCYSEPTENGSTPVDVRMSRDSVEVCLNTTSPGEQWDREKLQRAFEYQATRNFWQSYIGSESVERRITWLFPTDGCYTRADLARDLMDEIGSPPTRKLYVFGNFAAQTWNLPEGLVRWAWHVVNMAQSGFPNGVSPETVVTWRRPRVTRIWPNIFSATRSEGHLCGMMRRIWT